MRNIAAGALLHPVALGAVVLLVVNDHVLKRVCPGWVTGKLSDFAGMVFFPLFLQGIWEIAAKANRGFAPSRRILLAAVVSTGLVFGWTKMTATGADAYRYGMALLRWPMRWVAGKTDGRLVPCAFAQDPTDLLALPMLVVGYWIGGARCFDQRRRTPASALMP
jgi:hypothetical protein